MEQTLRKLDSTMFLSLSVDVYNFSVYFYIYEIVYKNHSYPLEKKWTHDSCLSYESLSIKCIY